MRAALWIALLAAAGAAAVALDRGALAQSAPAAKPAAAAATASTTATTATSFREVTWDDLTPKDWDPLKQFRDMNFGAMSDADPKAIEMLRRMRETWDNAPTNVALDGQNVRIPGYLVPLDDTKDGLTQFLLVPYFGACIHTPPPPSNQIIEVRPKQPVKGFRPMDTVWVSGTLRTLRSETYMGTSSYRMDALRVEPYVKNSVDR